VTPVITAAVTDGFLIPLAYGDVSDWYRNLKGAGQGTLKWQGKLYAIASPELVDDELASAAFPSRWRSQLERFGVTRFVKVQVIASADAVAEGRATKRASAARTMMILRERIWSV
jgi:hypothetical protein